jgi:5-methylcytosine-specific restriction endonuclease McrA
MKYSLPDPRERISDDELINDIKRVARRLKVKQLSMVTYDLHGKYSAATCARRFGGWHTALEKAGVCSVTVLKYTTRDLMENMKAVWDTLGKPPDGNQMKKPLSKFSRLPYVWRFGSWKRALEVFVLYANCRSAKKRAELLEESAHKRGAGSARHITKGTRFDVLKRDNYKCRLCGASPAVDPRVRLQVDHIIPWSKGGRTVEGNLQTLCMECNIGKGVKSIDN